MLTIRLQRRGRKNDPSFRVLVLEKDRGPKSGSYLEMVGSYDARTDRAELNAERIKHWIERGAQVSDTLHNLLVSKGIVEGKKRNVLPKKTVAKPAPTEASGVEAPAAEAAPSDTPVEVPADAPAEVEEKPAEADATPAEVPAEEAPATEEKPAE